ncbi:MAG: peptide MFS transporter [Pseudomonadota bacterium]
MTNASNGPAGGQAGELWGHPKGLYFIVFTEAWERFSFYGMQALLVLYMATYLFQPGAVDNIIGFPAFRGVIEDVFGDLSVQALASQVFGLYVGLVYFAPVFGGYLGDRFVGRRNAVFIGGVLMAVGHFMMAFEPLFLFALSALILGSGFLKGNLAAQVGDLYQKTDQRRDTAFSLYVMSINVGAFVAPLVCGTLGELYGWHYGFGVAGVGMIVGLMIYLIGSGHLPKERNLKDKAVRPRLQQGDGVVIAAIILMLAITALYWTAQTQVWNTYPLWIKGRVDREVLGFLTPVTWFQSLDSLAVLLLAPFVIWLWRRQSVRQAEPDDVTKIAIGCAAFAIANVWLALGEYQSGSGQVAIVWPVVYHFICAVGFLYIGPIALSLTSRAAPAAVNAMMVGSYYLAIFVGGIASGWLGRFYEKMSPEAFWLMHAGVVGAGAFLMLVLKGGLLRAMKLDETRKTQAESEPEAAKA